MVGKPHNTNTKASWEEDVDFRSPFGVVEPQLPSQNRRQWPAWIWSIIGAGAVLLVIALGFGVTRFTNDPYRTLEEFSAAEYLADFEPLIGAQFQADLIVEADLGVDPVKGRLLAFLEKSTNRIVAVLVPLDQQKAAFAMSRYEIE